MENILKKEINNLLELRLIKPTINYSDRLDKIKKGFDLYKYNYNISKLHIYLDLAEKAEIDINLPEDVIEERKQFKAQVDMTKEEFNKIIQEYGEHIKNK